MRCAIHAHADDGKLFGNIDAVFHQGFFFPIAGIARKRGCQLLGRVASRDLGLRRKGAHIGFDEAGETDGACVFGTPIGSVHHAPGND